MLAYANRGLTADEVVDLVERLVLNVYVVYTCDDVVYFHLYQGSFKALLRLY